MTLGSQAKTERDLHEIVDLSGSLRDQAINDATAQVDGRSLPGGPAMIALAPVANIAVWEHRIETAEHDWAQAEAVRRGVEEALVLAGPSRPDFTADEDDTTEPALQVLRFWTDQYRRALDAQWDMIPTLNTEAKFLIHSLNWISANEPNWDHFRRDINRARTHLESILSAGRRPDRTRVVCNNPGCDRHPQLIRTYGARYITAWECQDCETQTPETRECTICHRPAPASTHRRCDRTVGTKDKQRPCGGDLVSTTPGHCPNRACSSTTAPDPVWTSDPADDRWKCTACKTRYDDVAYRIAHAEQLRDESAAKYVSLRDAIGTLKAQGRSERTIRKWLAPPLKAEDQCTRCRKRWPHQEHNVCPRRLKARGTGALTGETCGGELAAVHSGDPEAVVESFCDLKTHHVWTWWPDLWRLHLTTQTRQRRSVS